MGLIWGSSGMFALRGCYVIGGFMPLSAIPLFIFSMSIEKVCATRSAFTRIGTTHARYLHQEKIIYIINSKN